jgi:hypothetical protein
MLQNYYKCVFPVGFREAKKQKGRVSPNYFFETKSGDISALEA